MLPTQGRTLVGPLVGMELPDLRSLLGPDEPAYRAKQLYDALYRQQVANLSEISVLPKSLQNQLVTSTFMGLPAIERRFDSV
ncbi:MAG TPA: 23S rRNA (adenine(2503)-C(2))-methyltransferase RlmN, partial [Bryobacteraceae bacterium]